MKYVCRCLILSALLALVVGRAGASGFTDVYVSKIKSEGFTITVVYRTWLGRMVIKSQDETRLRETVFDPGTGALLQDKIIPIDHITLLEDLGRFVDGELRNNRSGRDAALPVDDRGTSTGANAPGDNGKKGAPGNANETRKQNSQNGPNNVNGNR